MKLKLEQTPERFLDIERPDGKTVRLTLRKMAVRDLDAQEALENDLKKRVKNGDITNIEYTMQRFEALCVDFKRDDIADLEGEHILEILRCLRELQTTKESEEKKSQ